MWRDRVVMFANTAIVMVFVGLMLPLADWQADAAERMSVGMSPGEMASQVRVLQDEASGVVRFLGNGADDDSARVVDEYLGFGQELWWTTVDGRHCVVRRWSDDSVTTTWVD